MQHAVSIDTTGLDFNPQIFSLQGEENLKI